MHMVRRIRVYLLSRLLSGSERRAAESDLGVCGEEMIEDPLPALNNQQSKRAATLVPTLQHGGQSHAPFVVPCPLAQNYCKKELPENYFRNSGWNLRPQSLQERSTLSRKYSWIRSSETFGLLGGRCFLVGGQRTLSPIKHWKCLWLPPGHWEG